MTDVTRTCRASVNNARSRLGDNRLAAVCSTGHIDAPVFRSRRSGCHRREDQWGNVLFNCLSFAVTYTTCTRHGWIVTAVSEGTV